MITVELNFNLNNKSIKSSEEEGSYRSNSSVTSNLNNQLNDEAINILNDPENVQVLAYNRKCPITPPLYNHNEVKDEKNLHSIPQISMDKKFSVCRIIGHRFLKEMTSSECSSKVSSQESENKKDVESIQTFDFKGILRNAQIKPETGSDSNLQLESHLNILSELDKIKLKTNVGSNSRSEIQRKNKSVHVPKQFQENPNSKSERLAYIEENLSAKVKKVVDLIGLFENKRPKHHIFEAKKTLGLLTDKQIENYTKFEMQKQ